MRSLLYRVEVMLDGIEDDLGELAKRHGKFGDEEFAKSRIWPGGFGRRAILR